MHSLTLSLASVASAYARSKDYHKHRDVLQAAVLVDEFVKELACALEATTPSAAAFDDIGPVPAGAELESEPQLAGDAAAASAGAAEG